MSRHGYTEDDGDDPLVLGRWRGQVASTIRGKRGQAFLREVLAALDAIPDKRLISEELKTVDGEFCTLGAVGAARGVDLEAIDPDDYDAVAAAFGIHPILAQEIMWENDEQVSRFDYVEVEICGPIHPRDNWGRHKRTVRVPADNAAERRWQHMREWVAGHIAAPTGEGA
jgi:hypothetical protein